VKRMNKERETRHESQYRIVASGTLDDCWAGWFNHMEISTELDENGNPIMVLTGSVVDQAYLRGLLIKIWDLNMEIISVNKIVP